MTSGGRDARIRPPGPVRAAGETRATGHDLLTTFTLPYRAGILFG